MPRVLYNYEEIQEEHPEVLMARPYQQQLRMMQQCSPTMDIMNMHHDMDDITAHKHQMIKVYQPFEL